MVSHVFPCALKRKFAKSWPDMIVDRTKQVFHLLPAFAVCIYPAYYLSRKKETCFYRHGFYQVRSQKQALSGQVVLSLSLLEVTLCQSGNKSELKAAGDRQSDAELMNFFVPRYKNNIWAVNILVLRSKLFHLGTIIRLTCDLSGTDRTVLGGPKEK